MCCRLGLLSEADMRSVIQAAWADLALLDLSVRHQDVRLLLERDEHEPLW